MRSYFDFTTYYLDMVGTQKKAKLYRFLEYIPGTLIWVTFFLAVVLSFTNSLWVIYFIILFDLYWLLRVLYFLIFIVFSWRRYARALKINWYERLGKEFPNKWSTYTHCVFFPFVKEDFHIIDCTLSALLHSTYDPKKFIVVLGGEERARAHFESMKQLVKEKYDGKFCDILFTVHPDELPGEMKTKGANLHWMGRKAKEYFDSKKIGYEHIIVSAFDSDTVVHEQYFACLTYTYCSTPNPQRASYQPVVMYNNNMWESRAPMRLASLSTTYWMLTELSRPDRLFTFSSHSMSFQALVDVGFWQNDIVSEDSRIFLQCYTHYQGNYRVVPMYLPVSMDAVTGPTPIKGFINLYKQQRRWAWGVEHFPYMMTKFFPHSGIPLKDRLRLIWIQVEGMYTWATAPIIILLLGRLPLMVAPSQVKTTVIAQNAPFILEWLLNASMIGLLVLGFLSFFLLPKRPDITPKHRMIYMILQWALLPISLIFFSSLPAIDAQTRLMLGKYLGFNVSEKRKK